MQLSAPGFARVEQFAIRFAGIETGAGQIEAQFAGAVIAFSAILFQFEGGIVGRYLDLGSQGLKSSRLAVSEANPNATGTANVGVPPSPQLTGYHCPLSHRPLP
ncbi:MAG: hypothetical protein V1706_08300 [Pseudomonadota bacterium]